MKNSPLLLHSKDRVTFFALKALAIATGAIVLLIFSFVAYESMPALRDVGLARFFGDASWFPQERAIEGTFGLLPMVVGSLLSTIGAVSIAAPIGVLAALFARLYAPKPIAKVYRLMVELLAGTPSVVFGFWGLVTLAPWIAKWQPPGQSLLAAMLILATMIVPTIALLTESAIVSLPKRYIAEAHALGLSRRRIVFGVILPLLRPAIFNAIFLAMARAIGETMAVLMVCGNVVKMPHSVFDPVRTLTSNIALEMGYALGAHRSALFDTGLLLIVVVTLMVLISHHLFARLSRV